MVDVRLNCNKVNEYVNSINDYLNSFYVDKIQNGNLSNSTSKENKNISISNSLLTKSLPAIESRKNEEKKRSRTTVPNNHEHFQERLRTFDFGSWTCTRISPLACASHGWKLSDKDILKCVTCNALVCSILPLPNQLEAYATFSTKLKDRLKTGHKDWCVWPNYPSPSEFLHPPLDITRHYFEELLESANKLCTLEESLPYFDVEEVLKKLEFDVKDIAKFYGRHTEMGKTHLTAAVLVLCGWSFGTCRKMRCNLCLRDIGLWNFVSLSQEEEYLRLKKRNEIKEGIRTRNQNRRRERERREAIREENERISQEMERKLQEEKMKDEEEAAKVKLAIEKIIQRENDDDSDLDGSIEDDELGEEEENDLLSEENVIEKDPTVKGIDQNNGVNNRSDKTNSEKKEETQSSESENSVPVEKGETSKELSDTESLSDNSDSEVSDSEKRSPSLEEGDSAEDDEDLDSQKGEETEDQQMGSDIKCEEEQRAENSEDEDRVGEEEDMAANSEDELWLEAVGGVNPGEDSVSTSSYDTDSKYKPQPIENPRKRRRNSDSSESDSDSEIENAAKYQRAEEEIACDPCTQEPTITAPEMSESRKRRRNSDSCDSDEGEKMAKYPRLDEKLQELEEKVALFAEQDAQNEICEEEEAVKEISDDEDEEVLSEEDATYDKMKKSVFEPLEQHRFWCGWVAKLSTLYVADEFVDPVLGYKILPPQLKKMLPEIPGHHLLTSEKYASNLAGFRTVSSILDSWSVPEVEVEEELADDDMETN